MGSSALSRAWAAFVSRDSYGVAILLLAVSYTLSVSVDTSWAPAAVVFVQIAVVWFVLRTSRAHRVARLTASCLMAASGVIAVTQLLIGSGDDVPSPAVPFVSSLLYFVALIAIVRHVANRDRIDMESTFGAVAAYLCLGFFFAFAYRTIAIAQAGPFFGSGGDGPMEDVLFFSMTTMTTTGYGNLVPVDNPGQSLAVLEMMVGQLYLIVVVGKVISALPARSRRSAADPDQEPR